MKTPNSRGAQGKPGAQSAAGRPQSRATKTAGERSRQGDWQTEERQSVSPGKRGRQPPTLTEGFGAGTASNSGRGQRKQPVSDPDHARLADPAAVRGGTKSGTRSGR